MDIRGIRHRIKETNETGSRPRVFVTAHHEDQDAYLERIIRMLQDQQNCIVYYYEGEAGATDKELSEALDDMQLIVAIVTIRMLREPSLAMDRIVPYALAHNIPVLPLMMEEDPLGLFGKKFGDLQYLMPDDPDKTAEPFEKKLEAYLADVLVSPETAQRIRDAFDACIFLSYRKKDRTFARELMKMIHRNPRYRDISFWYDEFLVPGEDFNDGISKALEDSDLFTMVVTPHLLEDPNYVMSHEYPAAQEKGKTIFPVEMDATDPAEMEKAYLDLPKIVAAGENADWDMELEEKLKKFCVRTEADKPEHTFLIGLAYLDGINMEVDTEKAVTLITAAADAGLEEAMRKLSLMYFRGKGVAKSVRSSAEWREKLRDSVRLRFYKDDADETLEELYREQNILCNLIFKLRDDVNAATGAYQLMDFAEKKLSRGLPGAKRDLAFTAAKVGSICQYLDVFYQSEEALKEAAEIYHELLEEEPSDELRRKLCSVYGFMGSLYGSRATTMAEEALESLEKAREQILAMEDEAYRESAQSQLIHLYRQSGDLLLRAERTEEALGMYTKAREEAEKIPAEKMVYKEKSALVNLYSSLADLEIDMGRREEAAAYRRKNIDILQLQIEEARDGGMRYAGLYNRLAGFYRLTGDYEEAVRCYDLCLNAPEDDPELPEVLEDHMNAYEGLGAVEYRLGHPDKGDTYYREELKLARALADRTGAPGHMDRVARWLEEHCRNDVDALEEALQIRQKLYMKLRIAEYRNRRDGLRNRLEWEYKDHPERKRYRVVTLSDGGEEAERLKEWLQKGGLKVHECDNGFDLSRYIMEIEPDLLILDAEKDKISSYESAAARIKDALTYVNPGPAVLLIAGKSQKWKLRRGVKEGRYQMIIRPFTADELINKVRNILGMRNGK